MDACSLYDSRRHDALTDLQRIRRTHTVRSLAVTMLLVILLVALALSDLALGHRTYSMNDLVGAVWGQGDEGTRFVILQLRLPRTCLLYTSDAADE